VFTGFWLAGPKVRDHWEDLGVSGKITLLGYLNAKVGKEDIFNPIIGNESRHETSNDNGVRVVNFATLKNLIVKTDCNNC
jgi:hypothetical protein